MAVVYNSNKFNQAFINIMGNALNKAGQMAASMMRSNLAAYSGTGKPEWHAQVAMAIQNIRMGMVNKVLTQAVGLVDSQSDTYFMIKAKLLEYGSGSRGDSAGGGSGEPIQHVSGVAGLNDDITGWAAVSDREDFFLPDAFNQSGTHWFRDAVVKAEEIFDEYIEDAWEELTKVLGDCLFTTKG